MFQLRHTNPGATYTYQTVWEGPIDFGKDDPFEIIRPVYRFGPEQDLAVPTPVPQPKPEPNLVGAAIFGAILGIGLAL